MASFPTQRPLGSGTPTSIATVSQGPSLQTAYLAVAATSNPSLKSRLRGQREGYPTLFILGATESAPPSPVTEPNPPDKLEDASKSWQGKTEKLRAWK